MRGRMDANALFAAVSVSDAMADAFAVKVNAGFGGYGDVGDGFCGHAQNCTHRIGYQNLAGFAKALNPTRSLVRKLIVNPMSSETQDMQMIALIHRVAAQGTDAHAAQVALKALYDLSSAKLYGLAMRVVRNSEWAEDVLQEAYLNIWRVAGDYRVNLSPPMAWMGLIVRSRALDLLRRRVSDRAGLTQELDEVLSETLAGGFPGSAGHHPSQRDRLGLARMPAQAGVAPT